MKINIEESIWTKYKKIVEVNKQKRKLTGCFYDNEPPEIIIDEELINDTDLSGRPIHYPWEMYHLLSQMWVHDLFGEDWQVIHKLLSVRDIDITRVNGWIYYRESDIKNVLDVLTILAKTQFVTHLRMLCQNAKENFRPIYTSKDLMSILNVKENTLRGYRDNLLLDYSKCGDKIWYTQDNLMDFLKRTNINNN